MFLLKKIALALSGIVLTATLTSCAPAQSLACGPFTGGEQIDSISVSETLGEKPVVTFPSPLSAEAIQARVVVEGDGPVFTGRNLVEFEFAGYNGGSGQLIQQSSFDGTETPSGFFGPGQVPNFCEALAGAKEGSRVVAILPPDQAHNGEGVPALGVGPADSFVFVIDLTKVFLEK